jgi:alginate O-acetyltransferase complex protein AlgI
MTFTSLPFIILIAVSLSGYWLLRPYRTARTLALVLASYVFYAAANPWYLILLFFISCVDYLLGTKISAARTPRSRKLFLALSIVSSLTALVIFKYINFLVNIPADIAAQFGAEWSRYDLNVPFPLGISFYVFQTISYVVDVYRKKMPPCDRFIDYLLYISFFPRIVAGPIVPAGQFFPQLAEKPVLTREKFGMAIFRIVLGLVKKLVIAEYIKLNLVDRAFDLPMFFSATEMFVACWASVLQLYCDFSGYMDIIIGLAMLYGLSLPENFIFPLKSRNVRALFRKWHITLSAWLRDYCFISLGGSRVSSQWKLHRNLLITMFLMGVWHGPSWAYVLHGVYYAVWMSTTHLLQGPGGPVDYEPGESKIKFASTVALNMLFFTGAVTMYRCSDMGYYFDILSRLWPFVLAFPPVFLVLFLVAIAGGAEAWPWIQEQGEFFETAFFSVSNMPLGVVGIIALAMAGAYFPANWYDRIRKYFARLPIWVQLLLAAVAAFGIYKATSFEVTSFEYQRF